MNHSRQVFPRLYHDVVHAAIYARVSSNRQTKAATIASQVAAMEQRVAQDQLKLEMELRFIDDGYSGATLVRPALERLRDMAAEGAIDRLYVHSPDRLARKYAYQVLLVDELRRCGVQVVFLNHQLGQSPEDDLLLQVQGMIAEYERAKILERSRRGKLHAARHGCVSVLCGAPYGYRYIAGQDGVEAHFDVVLEEARVVRQIFQWIGAGRLSIGEVCRRLKEQHIPSPRGKSYWDRSSVWGILKNPAYKGEAAFGKTRVGERRPTLRPQRNIAEQPRKAYGVYDTPPQEWIVIPVPALVEKELFEAVQEQLEENRRRRRQSRRGAAYLLQGLLLCRCCGYALYAKPISPAGRKGKPRHYAYYRCIGTDAYRFGGQRICWNKQVRTDMLEEAVWEDVVKLLADPQRVQREYERRLQAQEHEGGQQKKQELRALIQKLQRGITRLIDAYEDGSLSKQEFGPRIQAAKERLARLEADLHWQEQQDIAQDELRLVIGRLEHFAAQVHNGLDHADWQTRREIVRTLVKRVEVDKDKVSVVYRVSPDPFAEAPSGAGLQHCGRGAESSVKQHLPQPSGPPDGTEGD